MVDLDFVVEDFFEDLPFFVFSGCEAPPLGGGPPKLGAGVEAAGESFTFSVTLALAVV